MTSDPNDETFKSVSVSSYSDAANERIMTDIDYTERLEKNVKQLQEMALEISKQGRKDKVDRKDWTKQNKDKFQAALAE